MKDDDKLYRDIEEMRLQMVKDGAVGLLISFVVSPILVYVIFKLVEV